ncbi:hypothetical protein BDZ94DRAFT_1210590 [Collybia nuda]|uniref:F-box domain-containing protein n=1 Tax=Collybia nuda TaxID=64659 RepID=A0A9P5YDY9_9AGAR|nr:hypothetical protein BDZ94DRAFT_1210590 [Collybia nuda]
MDILLVTGVPSDPRIELIEVESEIEKARALLDHLLEKHITIKRRINSHYSPILRLPAEILSEIFMDCYPVNNREQWISDTPLLLGSICTVWRAAAWSISQLWSTISLTIHEGVYSTDKFILFRDWLARACEQPLSLSVEYSSLSISDSDSLEHSTENQQIVSDALNLITQRCKQWENVDLQMYQSLQALGHSFPEEFTHLKFLRLFGEEYRADDIKVFHSASQLREVHLHIFDSPATAALHFPQNPNMQLTLYGGTVHDCLHILRHRPNLVHFGIKNLLLPRISTIFEPATAPFLQALEVAHVTMRNRHPSFETGAFKLLANLTAPALHSLKIVSKDDSWFEALELAEFISRSSCLLTKLSITCDSIDLGGCLSLTPALVELHLCIDEMTEDDWMELAIDEDPSPTTICFIVAPCLTHITFTLTADGTLNCIGLARMAASRRQPTPVSEYFSQLVEFNLVDFESSSEPFPFEVILEESVGLRKGEVW